MCTVNVGNDNVYLILKFEELGEACYAIGIKTIMDTIYNMLFFTIERQEQLTSGKSMLFKFYHVRATSSYYCYIIL